jgi:hypothetical protein
MSGQVTVISGPYGCGKSTLLRAAAGSPDGILTADLTTEVFGIRVAIITDPVSGRPLVLPIGTRHTDPAYLDEASRVPCRTGPVAPSTTGQTASAEAGQIAPSVAG